MTARFFTLPKQFQAPPRLVWLAGLCCLLACSTGSTVRGQTFGRQRLFGRYQQFTWTDQHGLPQNGISTVVQTPDGYLWLATAEGVVRFDGVRFTAFDTANTPELKSNNVAVLVVDRAGALWAGYGGGLTRYHDGRFTFYGTAQGLPNNRVTTLFADHANNLWIGTEGGGVSVFRSGRFAAYTTQNGLPDNRVRAFAETPDGTMWIGTRGGLAQFRDDRFSNYSTREGLASNQTQSLCWDRAGTLWIGAENGGLTRGQAGRFSAAGVPLGLQRHRVQAIAEDRDGGSRTISITLTDEDGTFANAGTKTITVSGPNITTQPPAAVNFCPPGRVYLSFMATGTGALSYRWRKGGVNLTNSGRLDGADTNQLAISDVQAGDADSYDCVVTDSTGSTTTTAAALTIGTPPTLSPATLPDGTTGVAYSRL